MKKLLTKREKGAILTKSHLREGTPERVRRRNQRKRKKVKKKYLTKERQSDIIDKLSKGAAVMFEN